MDIIGLCSAEATVALVMLAAMIGYLAGFFLAFMFHVENARAQERERCARHLEGSIVIAPDDARKCAAVLRTIGDPR